MMTLIFILTILMIAGLPYSLMVPMWAFIPNIHLAYPTPPWHQDQLDQNSRAFHQHLVNHALLGLTASFMTYFALVTQNEWLFRIGCFGYALSFAYPFFKEFYWDAVHLRKPKNNHDWIERLAGELVTAPIFIMSVIQHGISSINS